MILEFLTTRLLYDISIVRLAHGFLHVLPLIL